MSLLDSIYETYARAASGSKDKIVDSIEPIVKSVEAMLEKVERRLSEAQKGRTGAQTQFDGLAQQQRNYFALVKEYQREVHAPRAPRAWGLLRVC